MKKKILKRIIENKALIAFFLSFLLGLIIILPNIIGGRGIYNLISDFNVQQIPFNKMINESIKQGSILWTWYNELGSNFIGTFSFYNLFSPFNIIGYLFPSSWFEYLIGPIFILKYAVAGLTSYLFLKRYVKNKNYAIIGSLLYSFSGFQLTNIMFYHFHDVVALFPLLLYTLDNLVYDNKKGRFAIVVALLAFTNWFFFIGEVVFVILYYFIKLVTKSYKFNIKQFFTIAFEAILGVGLCAIVLLPSMFFVSENPRINSNWNINNLFMYNYFSMYIEILRSFIFLPQLMYVRSFITEMNYTSVELYLPMVGIVLAFVYFIKKPKSWISILFIICCLFMFVPILNSSFFAFKNNYYARWFYMPSLILSLMSIKCLENKYKIHNGIIFTLFCYCIFCMLILIYKFNNNINIIFDSTYFILTVFFSLSNLICIYMIMQFKKEKNRIIAYILAIFIFVSCWGNYMVYKYKNNTFNIDSKYVNYLNSSQNLKVDSNSRTNSDDNCSYNLGYLTLNNNIKSFNSNLNGSNFEFYESIDYSREVSTIINPSDKNLNDFLSVKYIFSCNENNNLLNYGYEFYQKNGSYFIYYNKDHKEFGFSVNNYMLDKEFKKLSTEDKKEKLKNTIILNEKQVKKYGYLYSLNRSVSYLSNEFKFKKNGFNSKINSSGETLAIYTIPYDEGWTAKVNDKVTKIEKVDNGMMAIKINKGENNIEFKYFTPGLKSGIIISITSLLIYIVYILFNREGSIKNYEKK